MNLVQKSGGVAAIHAIVARRVMGERNKGVGRGGCGDMASPLPAEHPVVRCRGCLVPTKKIFTTSHRMFDTCMEY
jgi:hypothetical protein